VLGPTRLMPHHGGSGRNEFGSHTSWFRRRRRRPTSARPRGSAGTGPTPDSGHHAQHLHTPARRVVFWGHGCRECEAGVRGAFCCGGAFCPGLRFRVGIGWRVRWRRRFRTGRARALHQRVRSGERAESGLQLAGRWSLLRHARSGLFLRLSGGPRCHVHERFVRSPGRDGRRDLFVKFRRDRRASAGR
jgi:hypothetical protein